MAYVQVAKALYDYEAQGDDELTLKEDDSLYILENDDADWYKAKLRRLNPDGTPMEQPDDEAQIGLVPANYVEEAEPLRLSRALYDYEAQNDDELTVAEDELLRVYESDGLWLLVKKQGHDSLGEGGVGKLGYVPANYVDEVEAVDTEEAAEVVEEPAHATASYIAPRSTSIPTITTTAPAVDKSDEIKMWAVSLLDSKKKKKKGTLGIGNGSLFFASDSDKAPVQKIPVLKITSYTIENKGKQVRVDLDPSVGVEGDVMMFACEKKESDELISKIDESRGKAERLAAAEIPEQDYTSAEPQETYPEPATAPPAPRAPLAPPLPGATTPHLPPPQRSAASAFLPPPQRRTGTTPSESPAATPTIETPPAPTNGHSRGEPCIALYDFEAQGDDELGVSENESLTLLERENDDWWKVRNAQGQEGVVPASYIEVAEGETPDNTEDSSAAQAAEAEAARKREEAEREQLLAAEQRRKEARDRLAREAEERRRREALKAQPAPTPPTTARSTVAAEGARAAAKDVRIPEGRSAPARPKEAGSKSKPAPGKTRVWHDRSGQFRVEAEFLGFNQGKLRLHKLNGVVIEVAIEKMSKPDIQYLEEVTGKQLLPKRERSAAEPAGRPPAASNGGNGDPRRGERERERMKEREREARRRQAAAQGPRRNIDWFEFFLAAGVDVHDCTRYATAFERDNIDDTILPDMDASVLRSMGLREGDNIRVMKFIDRKYKPQRSTTGMSQGDIAKQLKSDEELARKLQEQERAAKGGGSSSPGLFSGPDGALKNNTRRGRPTPKTTSNSVDAASIVAASESLGRVSSPAQRSSTSSPNIERGSGQAKAPTETATPASGFDDDAWTPRPNSAKPTSPAPPPKTVTPTPPPVAKAPTPPPQPPAPVEAPKPAADPNSALFEKLAAMKAPSAAGPPPRANLSPTSSFLGAGGYNPNGPRGPMAPVPQNQGLLQPLVSTQGTGQFVPTRGGMLGSQPTGMMGQQATGWSGMQQQTTGFYGGGFQQQPQQTGFGGISSQPTGWMGAQQTAMATNISGFNSPSPQPASGYQMQQQQQQQQQQSPQTNLSLQPTGMGQNGNGPSSSADKYGAGNIFAQMKSGQFGKDNSAAAQPPNKYDALRPQPTGWSPAGVQQPQQTGLFGGVSGGMYPQSTGMGGVSMMQPQFTAMQQQPQQQQQGGMMMYGQPTGFNGQMQFGQQQQQPQQGYGYQQQY